MPRMVTWNCVFCEAEISGERENGRPPYYRNEIEAWCERCQTCIECHQPISHSSLLGSARRVAGGGTVCRICRDEYRVVHYPNDWWNFYTRLSDCVYLEDVCEFALGSWAAQHAYYDGASWYLESPEARAEREAREEEEARAREREEAERYRNCPLRYDSNVLRHCGYDSAGLAAGKLMFGVELEMEPTSTYRDNSQMEVVKALGGNVSERFIVKSDGSLLDGAELVTIPLTLDDHRSVFGWKATLAPVLRVAQSGRDTTRCGMHVHINRRALSALQIGKMLVFCNSDQNAAFVRCVAQRASGQYCERSEKKISDGARRGDSRYDILNVSGSNTIEVRMFRGNLRWQRVLKNLEFCHALTIYCKDASIRAVENHLGFLAWLGKRRAEYPFLSEFLATNGYLVSAKKMEPVADA